MIEAMLLFTHRIKPKEKVTVIKDDPEDDRILECALDCNADYIVSGDGHLQKLNKFKDIRILTAKQFLDIIR
jgi:uncharacterized protein